MNQLRIAIASGKGGTGKTTIATNLAFYLASRGNRVLYADCDVEEPNGHLFLKPRWQKMIPVQIKVPHFDQDRCSNCGECSEICQYNAIAVLSDKVMFFPSLCHSCGGCYHICTEKAITELDREIGQIRIGRGYGTTILEGRLNIGEAISPPVIKKLRNQLDDDSICIIDAPPGTSCPVIESVRETDFVVLVTEPTPFGLNDLNLAVGMVRKIGLPFGVVVNRLGIGDNRVIKYCKEENIPILMELSEDRQIAEVYSTGGLLLDFLPEYRPFFKRLLNGVLSHLKPSGVPV